MEEKTGTEKQEQRKNPENWSQLRLNDKLFVTYQSNRPRRRVLEVRVTGIIQYKKRTKVKVAAQCFSKGLEFEVFNDALLTRQFASSWRNGARFLQDDKQLHFQSEELSKMKEECELEKATGRMLKYLEREVPNLPTEDLKKLSERLKQLKCFFEQQEPRKQ